MAYLAKVSKAFFSSRAQTQKWLVLPESRFGERFIVERPSEAEDVLLLHVLHGLISSSAAVHRVYPTLNGTYRSVPLAARRLGYEWFAALHTW